MALDFPTDIPKDSGIEYWKLPAHDARVVRRIPIWVDEPVVFCKEACNFQPHWYQEKLIADKHMFIAASWSRQIGKSEAIAHMAIWKAMTSRDVDIIIIAPGQRQAKLLYRKVVQAIQGSPLVYNSVVGKIKMEECLFTSGCRIINLPSGEEGDTLRGYTITLLIIDESAFVPDNVFVAIEQGLSSAGGQEIAISTPRGRHNEFFRMFFPSEIEEHFPLREDGRMINGHHIVGDWSLHHYDYTVGLNVLKPDGRPQLSKLHIERQKRKLPAWRWRSEYLAEFVEEIDSYFKTELIDRMFNPSFDIYHSPPTDGLRFMAVDIAKGRDFTAAAVGERLDTNPITKQPLKYPHVHVQYMTYWKSADIESQYPRFIGMAETWRPMRIYFDKTTMGERPYEELRDTYQLPIEGIHFTQQAKVHAFGTLNMLMSTPGEIEGWNSRIQCYQDKEAIKQFHNLVYELGQLRSRTGRMRPGDNIKIYAGHGHDDIPVTFALLSLCVSGMAITAPFSHIPKTALLQRDASVRLTMAGIPTSSAPIVGVGDSLASQHRRRRNRKVFW